jgi:hypothetical protein
MDIRMSVDYSLDSIGNIMVYQEGAEMVAWRKRGFMSTGY